MIYQNCIFINLFDIKSFRRRSLSVFTCFRLWGLVSERWRWRRRRRGDANLESQEERGDEEGRFKIRNIERVVGRGGVGGDGGGRRGGEVAKYL